MVKIQIESGNDVFNLSRVVFEPNFGGLRGFIWVSDKKGNPNLGEYTLQPFGMRITLTGVESGDNHLKFKSGWSS